MRQIIWSNVAPSGRSYTAHVKSVKIEDGLGEQSRNNTRSFQEVVLLAGGGPIRTHPGLVQLLDLIGAGYSVDGSLEQDTAVVGPERVVVRVTGMFAG